VSETGRRTLPGFTVKAALAALLGANCLLYAAPGEPRKAVDAFAIVELDVALSQAPARA
jgi:hypothetical protein